MTTNSTVETFLAEQDHPFKQEIKAIRDIILAVSPEITEEVKWNAPSFSYKGYMATFNLWATDHVHLIFHNGAILKDQTGLLAGDYKDRRMVYFKNMAEVKAKKAALIKTVKAWIKAMDEAPPAEPTPTYTN